MNNLEANFQTQPLSRQELAYQMHQPQGYVWDWGVVDFNPQLQGSGTTGFEL